MADIAALKTAAEQAKTQVTRLEVQAETASKELASARERLTELGFDPDSDVDAEIARRRTELDAEGASILADLQTVRTEAGL